MGFNGILRNLTENKGMNGLKIILLHGPGPGMGRAHGAGPGPGLVHIWARTFFRNTILNNLNIVYIIES